MSLVLRLGGMRAGEGSRAKGKKGGRPGRAAKRFPMPGIARRRIRRMNAQKAEVEKAEKAGQRGSPKPPRRRPLWNPPRLPAGAGGRSPRSRTAHRGPKGLSPAPHRVALEDERQRDADAVLALGHHAHVDVAHRGHLEAARRLLDHRQGGVQDPGGGLGRGGASGCGAISGRGSRSDRGGRRWERDGERWGQGGKRKGAKLVRRRRSRMPPAGSRSEQRAAGERGWTKFALRFMARAQR